MMFTSGVAKVSFRKFLEYTFPATLLKSGMLVLVGMYFGNAYQEINKYLDYMSYITITLVVLLLFVYYFFHRRAKEFFEKKDNNED